MRTRSTRGITLYETLVSAACGAVILSVCAAVSPQRQDGAGHPRAMQDMTQLRDLITAVIIFGESNNDRYPSPGLINRLPDEQGQEIPGFGEEDVTANTTANVYAALIAQRYIAPEKIISPIERNPRVRADADYDFDQYNPAEDVYWDDAFAADLTTESNVSYAHLPVFGKRKVIQWRASFDAQYCVFGNRGPKDGKPDPDSKTTDPLGFWSGNVAFNDTHVEMFRDFAPSVVNRDKADPDNLFAFDDGKDGADIVLTFTATMGKDGPTVQFD